MGRHRSDLEGTFEERCAALANAKRKAASEMPHGRERDALELEIRQLETATHISDWLLPSAVRPQVLQSGASASKK